jgi:hypothetical protein
VAVTGITVATQLTLGLAFACALVPPRVACWGSNDFGQVGIRPDVSHSVVTPVLVDGV